MSFFLFGMLMSNAGATTIQALKSDKKWDKQQIVELFHFMIPNFGHTETGKYLDSKM